MLLGVRSKFCPNHLNTGDNDLTHISDDSVQKHHEKQSDVGLNPDRNQVCCLDKYLFLHHRISTAIQGYRASQAIFRPGANL